MTFGEFMKDMWIKYFEHNDGTLEIRCYHCDDQITCVEPGTIWAMIRELIINHDCYEEVR